MKNPNELLSAEDRFELHHFAVNVMGLVNMIALDEKLDPRVLEFAKNVHKNATEIANHFDDKFLDKAPGVSINLGGDE